QKQLAKWVAQLKIIKELQRNVAHNVDGPEMQPNTSSLAVANLHPITLKEPHLAIDPFERERYCFPHKSIKVQIKGISLRSFSMIFDFSSYITGTHINTTLNSFISPPFSTQGTL